MKHCLLLLLLCYMNAASAQINVSANSNRIFDGPGRIMPLVGPKPVDNSSFIDIKEGSPMFQDVWAKSTLIGKDKSVYEDITVKVNLLDNRVYYMDSTGKELVVGIPLEQIKLTSQGNGKMVHLIHGSMLQPAREGWFQLLVNDMLTLVKGIKKSFDQHTSYGGSPEYSIKTIETYYVIYNDKEYEVRKPSDLADILPTKKAVINTYIKNMGKLPREEQLAATVLYCNTVLN